MAYSIYYITGTLLAMQVPFVGFNALHSSEHMASHAVFIVLQTRLFISFIRTYTGTHFKKIVRFLIFSTIIVLVFGLLFLILTGKTKWGGRSLTLLDPSYAKKYLPIIASVSEHQATTWTSYFFDLHYLVIFTPVGLFYCSRKPTNLKIFISIYVVFSVYFASVMVRLLL